MSRYYTIVRWAAALGAAAGALALVVLSATGGGDVFYHI